MSLIHPQNSGFLQSELSRQDFTSVTCYMALCLGLDSCPGNLNPTRTERARLEQN